MCHRVTRSWPHPLAFQPKSLLACPCYWPEAVDLVEVSWRNSGLNILSRHPSCSRVSKYSEGKFETRDHHTAYTKTTIWGGGCWGDFGLVLINSFHHMFPIKSCLYCVFTEWCNQRNCERVFPKCWSYFSLPGFKWALAGFVSQCFSFKNVNASLDLYQTLYTLPFLSFSFFLDQIQTTRVPFQSGTSAQIYVSSSVYLEGKSLHILGNVKRP